MNIFNCRGAFTTPSVSFLFALWQGENFNRRMFESGVRSYAPQSKWYVGVHLPYKIFGKNFFAIGLSLPLNIFSTLYIDQRPIGGYRPF